VGYKVFAWALPIAIDRIQPIPASFPNTDGDWAIPDIDSLEMMMEGCLLNRLDAYEFGTRASAWLHQNRTWEQTADNLINFMKESEVWH